MTGPVRHQELVTVKQQAGEIICELILMVKSMYILGDFEEMVINSRPVGDIVADLIGATTAAEMLAAFATPPAAAPTHGEPSSE
jgi:hypothetical protein